MLHDAMQIMGISEGAEALFRRLLWCEHGRGHLALTKHRKNRICEELQITRKEMKAGLAELVKHEFIYPPEATPDPELKEYLLRSIFSYPQGPEQLYRAMDKGELTIQYNGNHRSVLFSLDPDPDAYEEPEGVTVVTLAPTP